MFSIHCTRVSGAERNELAIFWYRSVVRSGSIADTLKGSEHAIEMRVWDMERRKRMRGEGGYVERREKECDEVS